MKFKGKNEKLLRWSNIQAAILSSIWSPGLSAEKEQNFLIQEKY